MCACIAQLKPEQQNNMSKLLVSWRSEQVVPASIISACEDKLPALSGGPSHHHHSDSGAAAAAAVGASSPPAQLAANGGYTGASDYVQAMAAAAVAAAAALQGKQLAPTKRVSHGQLGQEVAGGHIRQLHTPNWRKHLQHRFGVLVALLLARADLPMCLATSYSIA
jgi:hypothetical protein